MFIPLLSGIISSMLAGDLSKINVKARPPPAVFGIVWTILYILIGVSWALETKGNTLINIFYSLLTISLFLWPIICTEYGLEQAMYVMLFCILFTILCIMVNSKVSNILISPLRIITQPTRYRDTIQNGKKFKSI